MSFSITTRTVQAGDRSGEAYILANSDRSARAEVWPSHGFNCLRWQVRLADGSWGDLFDVAPDWEQNPVPTRSGHPILFPFPNRIRNGRFSHNGTIYQLPLNDSTGKHAIHGFTPRNPWRVVGMEATDTAAAVTGEFHLSIDLPNSVRYWPADFTLRVTYRLFADRLRVEACVTNPDNRTLPWGLGYHGYFRLPAPVGVKVNEYVVRSAGNRIWEAIENLPTGHRLPVESANDLRVGRQLNDTSLDQLYGDVGTFRTESCGLNEVANVVSPSAPCRISVWVSAEFRELLLFTPPHRRAIAIEPYSCATDAANLSASGIDSGWHVLPQGDFVTPVVEYRWEPNPEPRPDLTRHDH